MSGHSFDVDPYQVLGVASTATLEEIRNAYRRQAKRYHPDAGGEDWVFRILAQAYEMLSAARVARATAAPAPSPHPERRAHPRSEPGAETVRQGLHDKDVPPHLQVAVEQLCVRYLWDGVEYLWINERVPDEERFLSCGLNLTWPDPNAPTSNLPEAELDRIATMLGDVVDRLILETRVVSSRNRVESGRFAAWLAYSSFDRSWRALGTLHSMLRARGLGLRQWSRDLFVPRSWR